MFDKEPRYLRPILEKEESFLIPIFKEDRFLDKENQNPVSISRKTKTKFLRKKLPKSLPADF